MDFSTNHSYQVGDIVTTMVRQITVPLPHEIWTSRSQDSAGKWAVANPDKVSIRLSTFDGEKCINTNVYRQGGLVCFLPKAVEGYAILSVKITRINGKSVEAVAEEYLKVSPMLDFDSIGQQALSVYSTYSACGRSCEWIKQTTETPEERESLERAYNRETERRIMGGGRW